MTAGGRFSIAMAAVARQQVLSSVSRCGMSFTEWPGGGRDSGVPVLVGVVNALRSSNMDGSTVGRYRRAIGG